jgi:sugar phosphate isomerase/epimerase
MISDVIYPSGYYLSPYKLIVTMNSFNRRAFLAKSTMALGAIAVAQTQDLFAAAGVNNMPVGFQTYPIREMLAKDFRGTLKIMSDMGYKIVEMCYPKTYAQLGFGPLASLKTSEIKSTIENAGLTCPSSHFGFADFTDEAKLDETIKFSHDLGITQVICSTFWIQNKPDLKISDYQEAADKLNKAAEKIKAAGLQAGFHNHSFEFVKVDDALVYDVLLQRFDPNLVKMQFQTEVINYGFKASDYFKKYPGRFFSAHLSDWTTDKKAVPIGKGIIDWKEFFKNAKKGGVKNIFVEMGFETLKESAAYLA